jgi:hypothetical protein
LGRFSRSATAGNACWAAESVVRLWAVIPGTMRVLFAFNPTRTAILLIGGDKRDRWQAFYAEMIPIADDLLDEHLTELEGKGAT